MRAERRDIRRLLEQLTPQQWAQDSLCSGWTVRDLAAHLVGWDDVLLYRSRREHGIALFRFVVLYGTSFGSMTVVNRRIQRRTRHLDTAALAACFGVDDGADLKWLFDGTNPGAHLAEYVIHHQDIRWPLGMPRHPEPDRLIGALEGIRQLPGVRVHAWWRRRRETLEATDIDWRGGRGPVHRMPGESILMALAVRNA